MPQRKSQMRQLNVGYLLEQVGFDMVMSFMASLRERTRMDAILIDGWMKGLCEPMK